MNKQELIETLMKRMEDFGYFLTFTKVKTFIREYEKLTKSEPQKPVVPQFVAEWIEYCKHHNFTLFGCFDPENGFERLTGESFEGDARKCIRWCRRASDKVAKAWLDGYEVEKEKRYLVKMKGVHPGSVYLKRQTEDDYWYFGVNSENKCIAIKHTRKELEEAGFGWIFSCEGVEVEEVKE